MMRFIAKFVIKSSTVLEVKINSERNAKLKQITQTRTLVFGVGERHLRRKEFLLNQDPFINIA